MNAFNTPNDPGPRLNESHRTDRPKDLSRASLATVALAIIVFFATAYSTLASRPLTDYDEAIYAQVAREALDSNSPFSFTWKGNFGLGRPAGWYEKPPLMIWLTELTFALVGRHEASARLPSFFFAIASAILSCLWLRISFHSNRAAAIAGAVLLLGFQFISNISVLQLDVPVGFFIMLSLFCFSQARRDERFFDLFWLSIGLGVMTKSIVGLLPIPIILIASGLARDWNYLLCRRFYTGVLLFLLITVPWHIVETILFGKVFWNQYLGYHLLDRWRMGIEGHGQPFGFYWDILAHQRFFFGLLLSSFGYTIYRSLKGSMDYSLVLAACAILFVFFSSSHTKLPAYILPIYPFAAASIGLSVDAAINLVNSRLALWATVLLFLGCLLLGVRYLAYEIRAVTKDHNARDSRSVGLFLQNHYAELPLYYASDAGTKPSVIYYADRVVGFLSSAKPQPPRPFLLIGGPDAQLYSSRVLSTPTEELFLVDK